VSTIRARKPLDVTAGHQTGIVGGPRGVELVALGPEIVAELSRGHQVAVAGGLGMVAARRVRSQSRR
jgi:hypothetical protein